MERDREKESKKYRDLVEAAGSKAHGHQAFAEAVLQQILDNTKELISQIKAGAATLDDALWAVSDIESNKALIAKSLVEGKFPKQ